jgi:hypothetical protein
MCGYFSMCGYIVCGDRVLLGRVECVGRYYVGIKYLRGVNDKGGMCGYIVCGDEYFRGGGMCGYVACKMLNGDRNIRCRMYGMGMEFAGVEHVVVFYINVVENVALSYVHVQNVVDR